MVGDDFDAGRHGMTEYEARCETDSAAGHVDRRKNFFQFVLALGGRMLYTVHSGTGSVIVRMEGFATA